MAQRVEQTTYQLEGWGFDSWLLQMHAKDEDAEARAALRRVGVRMLDSKSTLFHVDVLV